MRKRGRVESGDLPYKFFLRLLCAAMLLSFVPGCTSSRLSMEDPSFRPKTQEPEEIVLQTVGNAGQSFSGHMMVDGKERSFSGVAPAEYAVSCRVLIVDFRKQSGEGSLSFRVGRGTNSWECGKVTGVGGSCRFGYCDGHIEWRTKEIRKL